MVSPLVPAIVTLSRVARHARPINRQVAGAGAESRRIVAGTGGRVGAECRRRRVGTGKRAGSIRHLHVRQGQEAQQRLEPWADRHRFTRAPMACQARPRSRAQKLSCRVSCRPLAITSPPCIFCPRSPSPTAGSAHGARRAVSPDPRCAEEPRPLGLGRESVRRHATVLRGSWSFSCCSTAPT